MEGLEAQGEGNKRIMDYKKEIVPIWKKVALTLEEATLYSNIGINKLREITNNPSCSFVIWIGNRRLIKRREFEKYIEKINQI